MASHTFDAPTAKLPLKQRGKETDFNDAIAWLLQANTAAALALASYAGVRMDPRRGVDVRVRQGGDAAGFPDFCIDGTTFQGGRARVLVELKTKLATGMTALERRGYRKWRNQAEEAAFLLAAPVGYTARWQVGGRYPTITLFELRDLLTEAGGTPLYRSLVSDIWTHFRGVSLRQSEVDSGLSEGDHTGLYHLLRPLMLHANEACPSLRAYKTAPGGAGTDEPWYGFGMYSDRIKAKNNYAAWIGFCRYETGARFQVNIRPKDAASGLAAARLSGETEAHDEGFYALTWYHPVADEYDLRSLRTGGLDRVLEVLEAARARGPR